MRAVVRTIARAAVVGACLLVAAVPMGGAHAETVEPLALSAKRQGVVDAAHYYLHERTPYVWSSGEEPCSVNGADCECLNRLAYRRGAGIDLPWTLGGQRDRGTRTSNPRPGDLVFFDLTGDGDVRDAHDHTGVFVGDGMMIHASSYWGRVYKQTISSFVDYERARPVYIQILA